MAITDTQIRALRGEARRAKDIVQVIICTIALGEREDLADDYSGGGHGRDELREIAGWLHASEDDARAECERVIAAAQG